MPFPTSERVVYGNSPLVRVICQIRFPTILEIGAADPAKFQEQIRAEYPLYERRDTSPQEAVQLAQRLGLSPPPANTTCVFKTEDEKREIHLTNESLSLAESSYERWEQFSASFEAAKSALEQVYEPAFYSRIGLRYTDLIYREKLGLEEADWAELMNPTLVGIFADADIGPKVDELYSQTAIFLGNGDRVRIAHGLGKQADADKFGYMIDADFFTTEKKGGSDVTAKLERFNRLAGRLFRWAITDRLHESLQPTKA